MEMFQGKDKKENKHKKENTRKKERKYIEKYIKCQKHKLITRKYQKDKEKKEKMNLENQVKFGKAKKILEKMDAYWIPNIQIKLD